MNNQLAVIALLISIASLSYGFQMKRHMASSPNSFATLQLSPLSSFDYMTETKIPWIETGYSSWNWKGNKINYLEVGAGLDENGKKKPALLLIHGFGASVYHWRYNIPFLARKYHVYAIDLLGFGLSDKPVIDYSAETWKDQVLDFVQEVVADSIVVAGNSLGGFTALYSAATDKNSLIKGCILLNAAGRFRSPEPEEVKEPQPEWLQGITSTFQRFVIGLSFIYTKQPARIAQVLRQVYPVDPTNVDDDLVQSIQFPSFHPNAAEVFYRVIAKNGNGPPMLVDDLLETFKLPLMLLWGSKDPWIRPSAADKIQSLYPQASRVNVEAGHCPHDEAPAAVNEAIDSFMRQVYV
jgi:pimeloyl-ACP methyl ester carboxylesterase